MRNTSYTTIDLLQQEVAQNSIKNYKRTGQNKKGKTKLTLTKVKSYEKLQKYVWPTIVNSNIEYVNTEKPETDDHLWPLGKSNLRIV